MMLVVHRGDIGAEPTNHEIKAINAGSPTEALAVCPTSLPKLMHMATIRIRGGWRHCFQTKESAMVHLEVMK